MSKSEKTIQENMKQLDDLLVWFESDEFSLEASIEKFKQAQTLAGEIETQLDTVKNDIVVLQQSFDEAA